MIIDIKKEVAEGQYNEFHILIETLTKFEVECIKDDKDEIIIRYPLGNGNHKECRPRSSASYKWRTKKINASNLPFGYKQLPLNGDFVVITGGEKDVLAFDMLGIPAVCMQSETANIPLNLIEELKKRFSNVMICYDRDETGEKFSRKWEKLFGLIRIKLPDDLDGKDIYDFYANCGTKEELAELIKASLNHHRFNKTSYSAMEVLELCNNTDYIIDSILPNSNLIGLIGGSDTGKSLFFLQFGINYILNRSFLGFDVNGGKKVLFFSFEDDPGSIKKRLGKMMSHFTEIEKKVVCERLYFEFDPDGLEQKIDEHMEIHPDTGVILLDPLTEVFQGVDINSPSSTRGNMQFLKRASAKYNIAIFFIHHTNKSSEESSKLSKTNSLGSQGIEAKSRLMVEMKKKSNLLSDFIELGIVKGNDVNEKYKVPKRTLKLKLNLETLCFEVLDSQSPNYVQNKKNEIDWRIIFGEKPEMLTKEILLAIDYQGYELKTRQKENLISEKLSTFRVSRGVYRNPFLSEKAANAGVRL